MAVPQVFVIAILFWLGHVGAGVIVIALLIGQLALMPKLLADPVGKTPWYNATGTTLSVLGMLASALGLGGVLPI
jgi:chlorophyll synthase